MDQLEVLRRVSSETGAPVAELVRRGVDSFLAARVPGYIPRSSCPALKSVEIAADPATNNP
jgi:hypothetical protein